MQIYVNNFYARKTRKIRKNQEKGELTGKMIGEYNKVVTSRIN